MGQAQYLPNTVDLCVLLLIFFSDVLDAFFDTTYLLLHSVAPALELCGQLCELHVLLSGHGGEPRDRSQEAAGDSDHETDEQRPGPARDSSVLGIAVCHGGMLPPVPRPRPIPSHAPILQQSVKRFLPQRCMSGHELLVFSRTPQGGIHAQ